MTQDRFLRAALDEAIAGRHEGGIPIGSVMVVDGDIVGRGHNRRVQRSSPVLHAEMDCLENAGRLTASVYRRATLYSTLSPCDMCSGAILLYEIPRVVVGEAQTFQGPTDYLRTRGVEVEIVDDPECIDLMERFIAGTPSCGTRTSGMSSAGVPSTEYRVRSTRSDLELGTRTWDLAIRLRTSLGLRTSDRALALGGLLELRGVRVVDRPAVPIP